MTARTETTETLNDRMAFDHVVEVRADGSVIDRHDIYAPELHNGELGSEEWTLLDGWSGQDRYSGPIMHQSEYIGGRMARWILETPGIYVALVDYPLDDSEPDGWAVATREVESEDSECELPIVSGSHTGDPTGAQCVEHGAPVWRSRFAGTCYHVAEELEDRADQ